jgi:putative peptidoglycan lipid II flippase
MLQVHGRFGPTASVPIVLNVCVVAAAAGLAGVFGPDRSAAHIEAVAFAVVAAGLIQVAWMLAALRGRGWLVRGAAAARGHLAEVLRQAGPMILGLGVIQINTFVDGLIASYPTTIGPTILGTPYPLQEGALASLAYAQRLYEFPLGVFGIAVATAIFPALARQSADAEAFAGILRRGLRLVVFIGLPASAGLVLVGPALVDVIYRGGEFGTTSAERVWRCLLGYAPAVWAYSMTHVVTRAFYARGDATTPLRLAVSMVGLNFLLNVALIWTPLREAGLAWSTSACAMIQACVLLRLMRRQARGILDRGVTAGWMRSAAATALMAAAVLVVNRILPETTTWMRSAVNLLVPVAAGAAVFAGAARALRMPELRWALGRGEAG